MICEICKDEVKNFIALGLHLKRKHSTTAKVYYDTYLKQPNDGICPMCGKPTNFQGIRLGYLKFCSSKCSNNSPDTIHKREQTTIEHFGVKNPYQAKEVKEKIVAHNLEKYGYAYNLQRPETIQQSQQTKLIKYGSTTYNNPEKAKDTCIKHFGVSSFSKTQMFKDMLSDIDIFGNTSGSGLETHFAYVEAQKKLGYITIQTAFERYGQSWYKNQIVPILYKYHTGFISLANEKIIKQYYLDNNGHSSQAENKLMSIIKHYYSGKVIHGDNKTLAPLELDFYIPDLKIAIEYNGSYWHSIKFKPLDYHFNKSMLCLEKGIRLIHFYEFESWEYITEFLNKLFNNQEIPTNDFNKYTPSMDKVDFSGPQPIADNIYGSGTFTILR